MKQNDNATTVMGTCHLIECGIPRFRIIVHKYNYNVEFLQFISSLHIKTSLSNNPKSSVTRPRNHIGLFVVVAGDRHNK